MLLLIAAMLYHVVDFVVMMLCTLTLMFRALSLVAMNGGADDIATDCDVDTWC